MYDFLLFFYLAVREILTKLSFLFCRAPSFLRLILDITNMSTKHLLKLLTISSGQKLVTWENLKAVMILSFSFCNYFTNL